MKRYLCSEPVCCRRSVVLTAVFLLFTLGMARGTTLVQDFYLPMPEAQIYQANSSIIGGTGSTIASTFSVVVTGEGTIIHYDQWEDGYETDLNNPAQSSTKIWGDGNDANGIPPGLAHDPAGLAVGTVITLTNNVVLPRNPATLYWDARDHLGATKALVITRAGWPVSPGPVFAGAVGVLSTMDFGTNYTSPVGQDMTNGLMKYVGMFVMAAQNNTTVTVDTNGTGAGAFNVVLNQGESYLINGGIKKGGRITASKPVQADLLIGHVGASYASDWFTLYPMEAWDNTYYTPVSTSAGGNPAYVYLFNPNTNALVINYATQSGSGSFALPGTNGVFQFQMPVGSGASFVSAGGQNFFPVCTVAASAASDTAYNWGFTLVPKDALTTEADVGWGPGSADGTVNGSPVWVTPQVATRIYVDYKGDHAGPLTDPNGNHYDTNFDLTTLQSKKIFDPSKNQTGMRVYTLDGTLITAAWGEDPDTAAPGNPYIDAGTTVLPFPVPTLFKSAVIVTDTPPVGLSLGDTIRYTVQIDNKGLLPLGNTVVIDAPTTNLLYLTNSTTWNGNAVSDSASGSAFPLDAPGFTIPIILSRGTSAFSYLSRVTASGAVSNSVNIGGTAIFSQAYLPPASAAAPVNVLFTDTNGASVSLYQAGANVYVTLTNVVGNTVSNTAQTLIVTVQDVTHGDRENILLTETGTNTGVFRNIGGLLSSTTTGLGQQDGTLNVTPGDTLFVTYLEPTYGSSASNTALIQIPALTKQLYLALTNGTQALDRVDPVAFAHGPTRTSADMSVPATPVLDSVTIFSNTASLTTTFAHTTAGVNRLMLVGISINRSTASTFETPTNVSYAGMPLSLVGSRTNLTASEAVIWIYALTNPPVGTTNVVVRWDQTQVDGDVIGCATFTGVNQTNPYGPFVANTGTSTAISLGLNSVPGELVYDTVAVRSANFGAAGSPGASQTTLWKAFYNARIGAGASTQPGGSTITNTWTAASAVDWVIAGISIKPVPVSGGTNSTTFVQTPVFCSSFVMPSNNLVTITNYITVTNGLMPANPAITATLKTNGVNFLTLTNPTYSSLSSNLVWSLLLPARFTVAGGQTISYVISNNEPGTAFHVNYDSTTMPSKISLPASTVITVNTLGIYDAPYPAGSLVTAPVAGSTLYVRAAVSDPFGTYDVTSLGLTITGPSPGANVSTNLTAANVVADDGCTKTYEFPWPTSATTGGYSLAATAHEGTEGVVAVATASLTLIFLDLGTPSTTQFTSGNNGPATNAYSGSLSGSACIRVTDLNRDTNSTTAQTMVAAVSSSSGDSEIITLTETSTNSGVFTVCVTISTNTVNVPNDGTLYAPVGSVLTASYSDPTDATDNSDATATILPPPGVSAVRMNKTIVSPLGGQVSGGQPVVFNLQVINTGSTWLTNVVVTDSFPSAQLSYSTASLTPTTVAASSLTWSNIGAMAPGQSTNISVTFIALASGAATNVATANGDTATNSSTATVLVTHSGLTITKMVLSPTNSPVAISSNVVFRVTIKNTGDTVIPTLPLEDNYSGAYFQFVSATIPPDGAGAGSLIWTNLASPVALATNAVITNDITMKVVGQGNPANNTAIADYAVDIFGNPVPTATGSTNIVTSAATISGFVYNDRDQSGTLTVTDAPLASVTVQLYTDPSGTGTPGTLVQLTTTSAGGFYAFDNLTLGRYVVVATDLPGFANSAPANGRLAFNLVSLTATTNNNFFQYQPNAALYSTFGGMVINDLAGTGANTNQSGLANISVDLVQDVNSNGIVDIGEPVANNVLTGANGSYTFAGITPGRYVIREMDPFGYYSTGDSQPPNNNQISFVTTNGVTSSTNYFFDRLLPSAINDTNTGLYLVPLTIYPLTNDLSPNGDPLTLSNAIVTGGILVINPGSTNLTFTPTNPGIATIIYTNADAHGGASSAVITITVTALADLAIGKSAPATVLAVSNLVYSISVTNLGLSGAASVVVTDSLPAGVSFVSASSGGVHNSGMVTWNLGNMVNGAVSNLTVTVLAPASGTLTNLAAVGSPTSDPNPTNNTTPPVITTVIPLADLVIAKSGPASVFAATNFSYIISVTNNGPSNAGGVVVTDTLPVGASFVTAGGGGVNNSGVVIWSLGTLAAGQASNLTVTVTAPASGTLTNVATISSPTGDTNILNNTAPPVITGVTPVADVVLGKSAPATVFAVSNLVYTISVTNLGPSTAGSVSVTDSLPVGVSFVGASGGGANNSGIVTWSLGTLASGAISNVTLTVLAPASGSITNIATGGSPTGDPSPTNNITPPVITTVTPLADVLITKSGPVSVYAATNFSYTISVTNSGPSSASGVVVTDTLPAGVSFVSASAGGVNNSGVVVWSLGTLALGQGSNLTVTVIAPASGTLTNVANVGSPTGDPNITNNVTPPVVTAIVPVADVLIVKSGPAFVLASGAINYTISVTNLGPSSASSVVVTDALPAGVGFVSANGGGVNNSGIVNWSLGTLAAGQVSNLTVAVTAPASGSLTNVATVNSPTVDTNLVNNTSAPIVTAVTVLADLAIGKSAPATVLAGSNFTYTISITNLGPSIASSITVTDALPVGTSFLSASGGGANNSGTVTWSLGSLLNGAVSNVTVTVLAPASGTLTNFAMAGSPTGDPNVTNNVTPPVVTTVVPLADVAIAKAGPAGVLAASNFSYTISVTNFGPSIASSVVVTDTLPASVAFVSASSGGVNNAGLVTWDLGALSSGQMSNLTVTVIAPASGTLTNVANVTSPTGDTNILNNLTPPVITTVTPVADVSVVKTGPAGITFGTNFTYILTVSNAGPSTAVSVTVTDALPAGLVFVSSIPATTTNTSNQVIWSLGNVAAGSGSNLTLTVNSTQRGSLTNLASGGSPTLDPAPTNNPAPPVVTLVTNIPPIANPDNYAMTENTTNIFSPVVNDFVQTPGGTLAVIAVSATNGLVSIFNGTNVIFTPTNNFRGTTIIGYTITDNVGGTNSSFITVLVTNIPPLANPDSFAIAENTTNTFVVLGNDFVVTPGGSLILLSVSTTNGAATTNGANVVFTPSPNYLGAVTLSYTISDSIGGTNSSTVTVLVTNLPPLANPDGYSVAENSTNTLAPLVNDLVLTPGGVLQIIGVSPTNGTATILNLTNVIFTPASNFVGAATIGYTITDAIGGTNASVITVTVTNIPPAAFGQSLATPQNSALPITLTGSDPASHPLTFSIVSGPAGGSLSGLNTNTGAVTYTPTNSFTGTDTFTFRVNNGFNSSPAATIAIAVTPVADLLVAQSGPGSGVAGANLTFTVAVTNLGPAGATNIVVTNQLDAGLTFVSASAAGATNGNHQIIWPLPVLPAGGATNLTVTLTALEGGTFTNVASGLSITPDLDVTNNNGSLTNARVVTSLSALADVAVFKTGTANVPAGGVVNYTIIATNVGPSTASNVIVRDSLPAGVGSPMASGNYVISNNVIVWAAVVLPGGTATNFTVTLTAPNGGTLTNIASSTSDTADPVPGNNDGSSPSSVVITPVTPVADLAISKSAAASVLATSNLVYTLTVTNLGPSTASSVTVTDAVPAGTSFVSASGGGANASGVVVWSLGNLPAGAISNFTLTVTAPISGMLTNIASGGSPTGDPNPTNNVTPPVLTTVTPVADVAIGKAGPAGATFNTNFSYTISVTNFGPSLASGILVTDTLPVGLVFVSAVPPTTTNGIGQVIWSLGNLPAGATTNLALSVISTARGAATNVAAVGAPTLDPSLTNNLSRPVITLVTNIPPVANPDSYTTGENSGTNVLSPLVNDLMLNPGGVLQLLSVATTNGTALISGTNVLFVPGSNYFGSLTITYSITDNAGGTNGSFITVLVTNIPPLANPDSYTVGENSGATTLSPLINDVVQTPGGILSLLSVSPTNGTTSISGTNVLFTPALNFFGLATIGYTITDGIGGTNSSLITVIVTNIPPVASGQSVNTPENMPVQIALTGSDPNLLPLTFAVVTSPTNGVLSGLNTNTGAVTYTPNLNSTNADSFQFRVNNGQTNSAPATVGIAITPVADLVVVESGPATGFAGSNLVFTVSVTNRGPAVAASLIVSNQLAAGFTFVSASAGGANLGNWVTWNFASLPANGVTNVTVTVFATEGGSYTNIASGGSALLDLNLTNNNGSLLNAKSITVITSVVDLVIFKDGGTNVFAGALVNYTITASNAGPSTATGTIVQDTLPAGATFQSASGTYTVSNNVVTWSGLTIAPGAMTTFNLTLLALPSATSFINIASGTSIGFDPNLTNNNGSFGKSRVTTKVTPSADVIAAVAGPTNAIVGLPFVFTLNVTNAGSSTASNVVASDILPAAFIFVSASNGGTNSNGTNGGGTIIWPPIASLLAGGTTNFTFTVKSFVAGTYTNIVSALSVTFDPNPTNNTGVLPAAQALTDLALPQFTSQPGTPVFNPQTGLYEEQVTVTNSGTITVAGIRLYTGGLRNGVSLYNASGTNNGVPYVQYGFPLDPGNTVHFVLEFYNPSRQPFTNSLFVEAYTPTNLTLTGITNSVPVNKVFLDSRLSPPRLVIEWASVPGKTYLVIYAGTVDATNWFIGTPSIRATANVTQWYDDGPPKTSSAPLSVNTRFYRVILY